METPLRDTNPMQKEREANLRAPFVTDALAKDKLVEERRPRKRPYSSTDWCKTAEKGNRWFLCKCPKKAINVAYGQFSTLSTQSSHSIAGPIARHILLYRPSTLPEITFRCLPLPVLPIPRRRFNASHFVLFKAFIVDHIALWIVPRSCQCEMSQKFTRRVQSRSHSEIHEPPDFPSPPEICAQAFSMTDPGSLREQSKDTCRTTP